MPIINNFLFRRRFSIGTVIMFRFRGTDPLK